MTKTDKQTMATHLTVYIASQFLQNMSLALSTKLTTVITFPAFGIVFMGTWRGTKVCNFTHTHTHAHAYVPLTFHSLAAHLPLTCHLPVSYFLLGYNSHATHMHVHIGGSKTAA